MYLSLLIGQLLDPLVVIFEPFHKLHKLQKTNLLNSKVALAELTALLECSGQPYLQFELRVFLPQLDHKIASHKRVIFCRKDCSTHNRERLLRQLDGHRRKVVCYLGAEGELSRDMAGIQWGL